MSKPRKRNTQTPEFFQKRLQRKSTSLHTAFTSNIKKATTLWKETKDFTTNPNQGWNQKRDYDIYIKGDTKNSNTLNPIYYPLLKKDLVEFFLETFPNKKKLTIIDDGAGEGQALSNLKRYLKRRGKETKTIAVSLNPEQELLKRQKKGEIDKVVIGPAEKSFAGKADIILSNFGSLAYTMYELRKDLLLKYAYSLNKGGILLVYFSIPFESFDGTINTLTGKDMNTRDFNKKPSFLKSPLKRIKKLFSKKISPLDLAKQNLARDMENIKTSFRKRGFNARFHVHISGQTTLLVQRIK